MKDLNVKLRKGGRITIPATLRKKFGIKGGTRIKIYLDEKLQQVILTPFARKSFDKITKS